MTTQPRGAPEDEAEEARRAKEIVTAAAEKVAADLAPHIKALDEKRAALAALRVQLNIEIRKG